MRVAEPSYLLLLWLVPVLAAFYVWSFRRRERLLQQFALTEMLARLLPPVSRTRQRAKAALLSTALVFGILALLRPQWGFHWEEMTRRGVDIMVAVDVSQSMMAEDVSPNRLERAQHELEDLLGLLEGDRIGLIAFAGTAFVQCPLTLDYGAFSMFLDYLSPELIPVPGTSITEAIRLAQQSFVEQSSTSKALIVITDGEDHEGSPVEAAKDAKEAGIKIYTIGIGGDQGAPIPSPDGDGFIKDAKGQLAMTRLDEETLQKIAVETGGAYVRSTSGSLDLDKIYTEGIKESLNATELKSTRQKKWEERFQWPLFVTVLIVLAEPFVSERRRRRASAAALLCLGLLGGAPTADAGILGDTTIQEGLNAYEKEDYATALQKFTDAGIEHPNDPLLDYNMGNAYYKTREFDKAEASYTKAIVRTTDAGLREKAYYNLGNTAFRQGKLDKAVEHYQEALKIDPTDMDAKRNLELTQQEIQRRLDAARQQQEKQKQEQQQEKQQSSGDQDQGGQGEKQQTQPEQQGDQNQQADQGQPTPAPGGQSQGEPTPSPDEQKQAAQQAQAGQENAEQKPENAQQAQQAEASGDNKEDGQEGEEQPVKMGQLSKEEAERLLNQVKDQQQAGMKARQQGGRGSRAPGGKPW